jgi:spiro-SPASM protein
MKNIAVINAVLVTPYAFQPILGNQNAFEKTAEFARTLPGVETIAVLGTKKLGAGASGKTIVRDSWSAKDLMTELKRLGQGHDNIFYFFADCPLLDKNCSQRMYENHLKYFSDYTFADGYPYGLSVEIIKTAILDPLLGLVKENDPLNRDTIFEVIKKDINAFDLETEIAPVDLRQLRVSLTADRKRNFALLKEVIAQGGTDEQSVLDVLLTKPEILRTLPSYISLQTVEGCPQVCSYCPYPVFRGDIAGKKAELDLGSCEKIVKQVKDFCEDAYISISLWGEPALHSRIDELISMILSHEGLELVIETSGIGWAKEKLVALASALPRFPYWIVSLDSPTAPGYEKLRGKGFAEAEDCANTLLEVYTDHAFIQAVRMQDNEDVLEQFYREWKKKTDNLIIQKYDHFAHFIPERKITDLSPLRRLPCWHLKRDLSVFIDGTVPLCKEDVKATRKMGNIFTDSLETIWKKGEAVYLDHIKENYPALCKECDEYYTYNF